MSGEEMNEIHYLRRCTRDQSLIYYSWWTVTESSLFSSLLVVFSMFSEQFWFEKRFTNGITWVKKDDKIKIKSSKARDLSKMLFSLYIFRFLLTRYAESLGQFAAASQSCNFSLRFFHSNQKDVSQSLFVI